MHAKQQPRHLMQGAGARGRARLEHRLHAAVEVFFPRIFSGLYMQQHRKPNCVLLRVQLREDPSYCARATERCESAFVIQRAHQVSPVIWLAQRLDLCHEILHCCPRLQSATEVPAVTAAPRGTLRRAEPTPLLERCPPTLSTAENDRTWTFRA